MSCAARVAARNTSNMPPRRPCPKPVGLAASTCRAGAAGRPRLQATRGFLSLTWKARPRSRALPSSRPRWPAKGLARVAGKAPFRKAWKLATPGPRTARRSAHSASSVLPDGASASVEQHADDDQVDLRSRASGIHRAEPRIQQRSRSTPPALGSAASGCGTGCAIRVALARERGNLGPADELGIHHLGSREAPAGASQQLPRARAPRAAQQAHGPRAARRGRWGFGHQYFKALPSFFSSSASGTAPGVK